MATNNNTPNPPGCSTPLKGCLVITAVVMALFIAAMVYVVRMPAMKSIQVCGTHMQELSDAVSRYKDVTGHRPANLELLAKQYLKDPSILRCPLDKSPGNEPSYTYNPKAKGQEVMLECNRHAMRRDMPNSRLVVLGDGTFTIVNPSIRESVKKAMEQAEHK